MLNVTYNHHTLSVIRLSVVVLSVVVLGVVALNLGLSFLDF
jgi:hypothetical protein